MPAVGNRRTSVPGGRYRKPKKVRRVKPSKGYSSPTAILGAKGQRKTERARRHYDRTAPKALRQNRRESVRDYSPERAFKEINRLTFTPGRSPSQERLRKTIQQEHGTWAELQAKVERREELRDRSDLERLLTHGLVGEIDPELARAGRKTAYGTANPGAAEVLLAAPIPGFGAAKLAVRGVKGVARLGKGASTARKAAGIKAATRAAPKPKKLPGARAKQPPPRSPRAGKKPTEAPKSLDDVFTRSGRRRIRKADRGPQPGAKPSIASRTRARYGKPGRKTRRTERQLALIRAGEALGPVAAVTAAGGQRMLEATVDDPAKVAKTTLRTAEGIPSAVAGIAADTAVSGKRAAEKLAGSDEYTWEEVAEPIKGQLDQQVAYYRKLGAIVGEDEDKARRVIQNDLGLIPAVTAGLTASAIVKPVGSIVRGGAPTPGPKVPRKVRKLERQAREGKSPKARREAKEKLETIDREGVLQAKAHRKRESERAAVTGEKREGHWHRERGPKLARLMGKLDRKDIDGNVTYADAVQLLGREDLVVDDVPFVRSELEKLRARLKPSTRELDPDSIHTRAVLSALLDEPDALARVLGDKTFRKAVDVIDEMQTVRSVERHEEVTGEPQTTPNPADERARLQHVARGEGVLLPEERPIPEVKGSRVTPRKGQDYADAVRRGAKQSEKRARKLRAQADELRKAGRTKRAAELEQRADVNMARAKAHRSVVDRFRRAEGLERQADEIDAGKAKGDRADADPKELRAEAKKLREAGEKAQAEQLADFVEETNAAIAASGRGGRPIFFRELDVADRGELNVAQDFPGAKAGKKERFRTGALAAQGRIDESGKTLLRNLYVTRGAMAQREAGRDFLIEHLWNGRFTDGAAWRRAKRSGEGPPPGYVLVPRSEFAAALQRADPDALEALTPATKIEPGRIYGAVPESALREFRAQMEPLGQGLKIVRAASRLQTGLMLATSPAWFAFQLIATPLAMFARNPNPVAWGRVAVKAAREWHKIDKRTRADFDAHFGATSADILTLGDTHVGLRPDTVRSMNKSLDIALKTPMGRILASLWQTAKRGGPLIELNRRYEAHLRRLEGLLEMDRMAGTRASGKARVSARVSNYLGSTTGLTFTVGKHLRELEGKSLDEQVRWYTHNKKAMREIENAVNDGIGAWSSLTKTEKKLASVVVFYPFLRFSLRWLFYSMPKHHPIRTAVLLNLSQANAVELEEVLGGSPDFFTDWGQMVTHTGEDGDAKHGVNLARAVPGGNSLVEALGSDDEFNLSDVFRPLQPIFGMTAMAIEGRDPFGRDSDANFLELMAKGAASLSPLTRSAGRKIGPEPSDVSKLFREIEGKGTGLGRDITPEFLTDLREQAETQRLSRLLEISSRRPDGSDEFNANTAAQRRELAKRERAADKAQAEIDGMMRAYGIQTQAEQDAEERRGFSNMDAIRDLADRGSDSGSSGGGIFKKSSGGNSWYSNRGGIFK